MRKWIMLSILATLTTGVWALEPAPGFATDFKAAEAKAKKEDKPLYLHFTTDWCGWCRRIENDIYKKPEGKEALKPFIAASLDCTQGQPNAKEYSALMQKYGGDGYPFLVILAPDGTHLASFSGYRPMPEFKKELQKALDVFKKYKTFKKMEKTADKNSLEYLKAAFTFYVDAGDMNKAGPITEKLIKLQNSGKDVGIPKAKLLFAELVFKAQNGATDAKIKKLMKAVVAADSNNKLGYKEEVLLRGAFADAQRGIMYQKAGQPKEAKAKLQLSEQQIDELTAKPDILKNPFQAFTLKARIKSMLGKTNEAIAAYEKMLTYNPPNETAEKIKQIITSLKAKRDVQSPATQPQ